MTNDYPLNKTTQCFVVFVFKPKGVVFWVEMSISLSIPKRRSGAPLDTFCGLSYGEEQLFPRPHIATWYFTFLVANSVDC